MPEFRSPQLVLFVFRLRIWHFVSPRCLTRCAINLSNLATPEVEKRATQATHTRYEHLQSLSHAKKAAFLEDFFSVFPVLHRNVGAGGQK